MNAPACQKTDEFFGERQKKDYFMLDTSSSSKIIDELAKIVGEREIIPEVILEKIKDIKDWNTILEHQKLLSKNLGREIPLQATILDYIVSNGLKSGQARPLELPANKKVLYTSIIDPLTGLYNERHFQTITEAELKRAKQFHTTLTIITLDADSFSTYTNLYGQETANVALKELAFIIKKSCRQEDILFRLRHNRFILLLLNISREGSRRVGERIRHNVAKFRFSGEDKLPAKKITVSGGIAIYPDDGKNSHTLITAAEEALATAKQSGKNRILEFSTKRRQAPRIELTIEAKYRIHGRKDIKPQGVYIKNISESGALVRGKPGLPLGNNIILSFKLPNGTAITVKGETVRIARKESVKEVAVAIKFNTISPQESAQLKEYIKKHL